REHEFSLEIAKLAIRATEFPSRIVQLLSLRFKMWARHVGGQFACGGLTCTAERHCMRWKKHSSEEIVTILAKMKAWMTEGVDIRDACRKAEISQATYFRWRSRYGRLDADQLGVIKRLQAENARLRRALTELESGIEL
ncbi:MAG: transposase, partial [Hyphomonadaceae bacterium]